MSDMPSTDKGFYSFANRVRRFRVWLRQAILEDRANEGLGGAPNGWQWYTFKSNQWGSSTSVDEFSVHFGNDAGDIQIARKWDDGNEARWALTLSAGDFRKIALWYLWRWAWGEWFGLRRKLYFAWLKRHVASWQQNKHYQ